MEIWIHSGMSLWGNLHEVSFATVTIKEFLIVIKDKKSLMDQSLV